MSHVFLLQMCNHVIKANLTIDVSVNHASLVQSLLEA